MCVCACEIISSRIISHHHTCRRSRSGPVCTVGSQYEAPDRGCVTALIHNTAAICCRCALHTSMAVEEGDVGDEETRIC
jgi:hypothetical protein